MYRPCMMVALMVSGLHTYTHKGMLYTLVCIEIAGKSLLHALAKSAAGGPAVALPAGVHIYIYRHRLFSVSSTRGPGSSWAFEMPICLFNSIMCAFHTWNLLCFQCCIHIINESCSLWHQRNMVSMDIRTCHCSVMAYIYCYIFAVHTYILVKLSSYVD